MTGARHDVAGPSERVRSAAVKLAALAQDGLTYAENAYDLDRYRQCADLAYELMSALDGRTPAEFRLELGRDVGYATPKVDVRGILFDADDRVLLMKEKSDGRWSLPGGWADPPDTPSYAVTREVAEETGYPTRAVRLIACLDREVQGHLPPFPVHVYKLLFLCERVGEPSEPDALETEAVDWFHVSNLPPLSIERVTPAQIQLALRHHHDASLPVAFD